MWQPWQYRRTVPNSARRVFTISIIPKLLLLLLSLLLLPVTARAQRIAFFPLLDLSQGPNGTNNALSTRLYQELQGRGHELIPPEEVMSFLVRNRIRILGRLTRYQTSLVKKELKADLILLGTVCQLDQGENPMLSLCLQLSRSSDQRIIWSQTVDLRPLDMTNLLGINDLYTLEELYPPFFTTLLTTMPQQPDNGVASKVHLNISTVSISPKQLRTGEEVSCKIRMYSSLTPDSTTPELFLQVEEQEYPLELDSEGYYLKSSWLATEEAGSYSVRLVARWPDGATRQGIIGSYQVDNQAPGTELHVIGTIQDGRTLFSDKLFIIPKLLNPEPISRWQITVLDDTDEPVVIMGASSDLPRRLTWRGKTSLGNMAEPGEYLIRFKVWDRAEYESVTEQKVEYLPEPPEFLVEVEQDAEGVRINLDNLIDTPLTFWWAKFFKEDGSLLKLVQGTKLPVDIQLAALETPGQKLECLLTARDILGNQSSRDIPNLFQLKEQDDLEEEGSMESEWVEGF